MLCPVLGAATDLATCPGDARQPHAMSFQAPVLIDGTSVVSGATKSVPFVVPSRGGLSSKYASSRRAEGSNGMIKGKYGIKNYPTVYIHG